MNLIDREQRDELVRLVLLELWKQADDRGLGEISAPGQGGRPSGRPPAGGSAEKSLKLKALTELIATLNALTVSSSSCPEDLRRVAELFELLGDQPLANRWWKKAALAGDEDARDYLDVLEEEALEIEHARPVLPVGDLRRNLDSRLRGLRRTLRESEIDRLMKEVERFLESPDQVVDGGRRL
ncbi:hypothetical protein [Streptomyces lavendulae]|uniref:hypothetical protein n=1 Tax=Streptomyces lavendulae TaxID=1914 RepID=UPI0036A12B14